MAETYKLTKEQEALLEPYRDRWIEIGLNCDEANLKEAIRGVHMTYKADGHKLPLLTAFFRSPLEGGAASAMMVKADGIPAWEGKVKTIVDKVLENHGITSAANRRLAYAELIKKAPGNYPERLASEEEMKEKPSVRVPKRLVQYCVALSLIKKGKS